MSRIENIENELESLDDCEELSIDSSSLKLTKPFLKWAGGKLRLFNNLKTYFPNGKRFIEPFLGAGSVALNVDYPHCIVSDINVDLANVWLFLKEYGDRFIGECCKLFIPENNTIKVFKELKTEFNSTKNTFRKATLFIYLNRHCFNGLCRYNASGEFNVPFGKYEKPYFPEKELKNCILKVQDFEIHHKDFRKVFEMVEMDDVVYCDPPYLPLSQTSSFDSYSSGGFSLKDQLDLAEISSAAAQRGATVIISNHYNWYSKEIYKEMYGAKICKISVARTISSNAEQRKAVKEVIAVFRKR